MKQSDLNHLRRLLGWIRCDIGQSPAELQQTMIDVAGGLGHPEISPEAKARMVETYRRAESIPLYVRAAVKALEKALAAGGGGRGVDPARATAETRASIGFDPGAAAGREPAHFEGRREIDSAGARHIFEAGFGSPSATQESGFVTDMTARVVRALRPFVEGFEGVRGHAEAAALLHELMATPSALAAPEPIEEVRDRSAERDTGKDRLSFHIWALVYGMDITPNDSCGYISPVTQCAWMRWNPPERAALSAQPDAQEGETC